MRTDSQASLAHLWVCELSLKLSILQRRFAPRHFTRSRTPVPALEAVDAINAQVDAALKAKRMTGALSILQAPYWLARHQQ